ILRLPYVRPHAQTSRPGVGVNTLLRQYQLGHARDHQRSVLVPQHHQPFLRDCNHFQHIAYLRIVVLLGLRLSFGSDTGLMCVFGHNVQPALCPAMHQPFLSQNVERGPYSSLELLPRGLLYVSLSMRLASRAASHVPGSRLPSMTISRTSDVVPVNCTLMSGLLAVRLFLFIVLSLVCAV